MVVQISAELNSIITCLCFRSLYYLVLQYFYNHFFPFVTVREICLPWPFQVRFMVLVLVMVLVMWIIHGKYIYIKILSLQIICRSKRYRDRKKIALCGLRWFKLNVSKCQKDVKCQIVNIWTKEEAHKKNKLT